MRRLTEQELLAIKSYDLRVYAEQHGYKVEGRATDNSTTMKGTYGKIVVKFDRSDNHWVFFPVLGGESGSIVDFYLFHTGETSVGKALGALKNESLGGKSPRLRIPRVAPTSIPAITRNQTALDAAFAETVAVDSSYWLQTVRAVGKEVLESPRFSGKIRKHPDDPYGNILFPHQDADGNFSGFEVRNHNFHGFFDGSPRKRPEERLVCEKGVWVSKWQEGDRIIVVGESALDMLSFHAVQGQKGASYASTGGAWGTHTIKALEAFIEHSKASEVWLAFDNDKAGDFYTKQTLALLSPLAAQKGIFLREVKPQASCKDWNEVLQATGVRSP